MLVQRSAHMYIVHMKRVTASDARRNWFRLLDEVAAGEVVRIERGGQTIVLRREEKPAVCEPVPDYSGILRAPSAGEADRWGWTWEEGAELRFSSDAEADPPTGAEGS